MPSVTGIEEALQLLAEDKKLALEMLAQCSEEDLANKWVSAPWAPALKKILGKYLLEMVAHLSQHNHQLFYYLKLQGKTVNTNASVWRYVNRNIKFFLMSISADGLTSNKFV